MCSLPVALSIKGKYALRYAAFGWHIFPLQPLSKRPYDGSKGLLDATTNPTTIEAWWTRYPEANIGLSCGPSGLYVIDVDPKNGGDDTFEDLRRGNEEAFRGAVTCLTPSGGSHYYFRIPRGLEAKSGADVYGRGIDVRTTGGYVILEPSELDDRNEQYPGKYEWEEGYNPKQGALIPLPPSLYPAVKQALASTPVSGEIIAGSRNDALTRKAGALRRLDLSAEALDAALQVENRRLCKPPLPASEVSTIAKSIARYEPGAPIGLTQGGSSGWRRHTFTKASEITQEQVSWLWEGRIPLGVVSAIVGEPGVGKTFLYCSIASMLSRGWVLPDADGPLTAESLIWAGEDRPGRIKERLELCGADTAKITFLNEEPGRGSIDQISEFLTANPAVKLVVLDPISSFVMGKNENSDNEVRECLAGLQDLAQRHMVAIVFLRHLSKDPERSILARILGSAAFGAVPRSILYIGENKRTKRRAVFSEKCSDDELAEPVEFFLGTNGFQFGKVDTELDKDAFAASRPDPTAPRQRSTVQEAGPWIVDLLKDGPIEANRAFQLGRQAGFSERTLKRAKKNLGVQSTQLKGQGPHFWVNHTKVAPQGANPEGQLETQKASGTLTGPLALDDEADLNLPYTTLEKNREETGPRGPECQLPGDYACARPHVDKVSERTETALDYASEVFGYDDQDPNPDLLFGAS